jgi:hypothetical protein
MKEGFADFFVAQETLFSDGSEELAPGEAEKRVLSKDGMKET